MRTFQEQNVISVIIPTLDVAGELPAAVAALADSGLVREIIVADGGSRDDTIAVARRAGTRIVVGPGGGGSQLAAGAAAASADWLLFLHADCRLTPGWELAIEAFVAAPDVPSRAGYFAFALDDESPAARRLECLVAGRCRAFAPPHGDHGPPLSRAPSDAVRGVAAAPLVGDVDLARRLGGRRLAPLAAPLYASARRYRQD